MRSFVCVTSLLVILGVGGCRQHDRTLIHNDAAFELSDKEMSPTAVFTTTSSSLIVKAAEKYLRAVYSWEPGKQPSLVTQGNMLDITRLSDDNFAAWYSDNDNQQFVVTFNPQHLTSQPLALPKTVPGWGECEGNNEVFVCIGNRPGMRMADKDFDEMAFTAVLIVDLGQSQRATHWFGVKHQTDYRFDLAHKLIYVSEWVAPPSSRVVNIFNFKGKKLGASDESNLQARSPSGRFMESLHEDGAEEWRIYEVASKQELFAFNCDKPGCKSGEHGDYYWNPVIDGQFAVIRDLGQAYGKDSTCDVYQALPQRLLKSIPCDGMPVYDWSRDGKELVTIQYLHGVYRRENVNQ